MEVQLEKVYVAVGRDVQEGLGTLGWAMNNCSPQSISIIILLVNISSDGFVTTLFGKLPANSVSDEKSEVYRTCEKERNKLLSKYKAFCGQCRTEFVEIENSEEPIHKVVMELILRLHITKLVIGVTSMKSTSRKGKSGIGGSFYVHSHKPDFCELFIICGGKLVSLQDATNEGHTQAGGELVTDNTKKEKKGSFRGWLEKILPNHSSNLSTTIPKRGSPHRQTHDEHEKWENCAEGIENYLQWLNSNLNDEEIGEEDGASEHSPIEEVLAEIKDTNMSTPQKIDALKAKIEEAKKMVQENRYEAKASKERRTKAEWVVSVCNRRARELENLVNEQVTLQINLKKEIDLVREQLEEASNDIQDSQNRLKSALELEEELKDILQAYYLETSRIEAQLEQAAIARAETFREVDEMRRQRDVARQRISFCKEREAILMSTNMAYSFREFTIYELREATENFSDRMVIKSGANGVIYKGRINHTMVAIKMKDSWSRLPQEEFQAKVNLVRQICHPHIIATVGFCSGPRSIITDYAHHRSLADLLFSPPPRRRSHPRSRRSRPPVLLPWHSRVRIAGEIASALAFLHSARPHGRLGPSAVLLDRSLSAKLSGVGEGGWEAEDPEAARGRDVRDLGVLMLQMLTGREEVATVVAAEGGVLVAEADESGGEWPTEVAVMFGGVGVRCARAEMGMAEVMREVEMLKQTAEIWRDQWEDRGYKDDEMDGSDVPRFFLCPILQEVMRQPHIAADGFSYEREAIEEWLQSGHDTSPMTNLKLHNTSLTPNHTLRSFIDDWLSNQS